jgi:hypothetical protein
MTWIELAQECDRVEALGLRFVALVTGRPPGRGARMRIAGSGSPLGEVVNVNADGKSVVHVPVSALRRWFKAPR